VSREIFTNVKTSGAMGSLAEDIFNRSELCAEKIRRPKYEIRNLRFEISKSPPMRTAPILDAWKNGFDFRICFGIRISVFEFDIPYFVSGLF
jgi:hypothetical protein